MYPRFQKLTSRVVLGGQRRMICVSPVPQKEDRIDNIDWRLKRGLPDNPNRIPMMRDGPDYTFLDGKPTPYGTGQKLRIIKQKEYTAEIIQLSKEVDFALDRYNKMKQDKEDKEKMIVASKLKQKGKKELS